MSTNNEQLTGWQLYKRVIDKLMAVRAKYKSLAEQVDISNLDEISKRRILMLLWGEELGI